MLKEISGINSSWKKSCCKLLIVIFPGFEGIPGQTVFVPGNKPWEIAKWRGLYQGRYVYIQQDRRDPRIIRVDFNWQQKPSNIGRNTMSFNVSSNKLEPGSMDFSKKLMAFAADLKKNGFLLKAQGVGDKRNQLYQRMLAKQGFKQVKPYVYETFAEWLEREEQ